MTKPFEKICMVGLGYIGLPTAVVFALRGVNVVGLDVNAEAVERINRGESHIVEPGLDDALRRVITVGALRATTSPETADAFLIAVPTPFLQDGNGHDCQSACKRDPLSARKRDPLAGLGSGDLTRQLAQRAA